MFLHLNSDLTESSDCVLLFFECARKLTGVFPMLAINKYLLSYIQGVLRVLWVIWQTLDKVLKRKINWRDGKQFENIYLRSRQTYRYREESSMCWLTHQMPAVTAPGPGQS